MALGAGVFLPVQAFSPAVYSHDLASQADALALIVYDAVGFLPLPAIWENYLRAKYRIPNDLDVEEMYLLLLAVKCHTTPSIRLDSGPRAF